MRVSLLRHPAAAVVAAALAATPLTAWAATPTQRIAGETRYATAEAVAAAGFASCASVVVATGASFPDALAAAGLAGTLRSPILLASTTGVPTSTANAIRRLGASRAYVVGGTASVAQSVVEELSRMGLTVGRIAGPDRQETSVQVMRAALDLGSASDTVIVCAGESFADALSVGPWAWSSASPILLARGGALTPSEVHAIRSDPHIRRVLIVGEADVASEPVRGQLGGGYEYVRVSGADKYATNAAVAAWSCEHGLTWDVPAITTGENFPDALAGSALQGARRSPLLLVADGQTSHAAGLVSSHGGEVSLLSVLGGSASVSESTVNAVTSGTKAPARAFRFKDFTLGVPDAWLGKVDFVEHGSGDTLDQQVFWREWSMLMRLTDRANISSNRPYRTSVRPDGKRVELSMGPDYFMAAVVTDGAGRTARVYLQVPNLDFLQRLWRGFKASDYQEYRSFLASTSGISADADEYEIAAEALLTLADHMTLG